MPPATPGRPDDFNRVEEFLQLLARAVRQFRTYPPASPLCADAIGACHKVFTTLNRDRLAIRVMPTELLIDHIGVGAGTIAARELVLRLHRARVTSLDVDRATTPRHFSHFCSTLVGCDATSQTKTFAELLAETGVDTIAPLMAHRPEVLEVGTPTAAVCQLVEHEQRRWQEAFAAGGPVDYLYPPDKGWVRLDPGTRLDSVSLVDLTLLVDNPADLATILLRLTDDDLLGEEERRNALTRKFPDVAMLFASLDPKLARVMFSKLARAVLDLEPARRTDLLRRTILPDLLDGRAAGAVLRDFPDVDLADSLCLLLELETAAPEVLTAALNRLDLPAERQQSVVPLIDAHLQRRSDRAAEKSQTREIDRLARRLVHIDGAGGRDFSEFAAFDLAIDGQTASALAAACDAIAATDLSRVRLRFLARLVRLEPNPGLAGTFLQGALALFDVFERAGQWQDLAEWASHFRLLAEALQESRPDVADVILASLTAFQAPARVAALVERYQRGIEDRRIARLLVESFGGAIVPGLVGLLDDAAQQAGAASAIALLCDHAPLLAPALASHLGHVGPSAARGIVRAIGSAGPGYEAILAEQLEHADEQVSREALRSLTKIGTARAAALVVDQIQAGRPSRQAAAEEALWHFPAARTAAQVRQLLGDRAFVTQRPDAARRMLSRAAQGETLDLDAVLADLEPLRFRFWNPALVRMALKARALRAR